MSLPIEIALPGQVQADVLALPVTDPVELAGDAARIVEEKLDGRLARLAQTGELKGEAGRALMLHLGGELQAPRLVVAGLGPRDEVGLDSFRTAGAAAARAARSAGGTIVWLLDESLQLSLEDQARGLVEGTILGSYDPGRWKTRREDGRRPFGVRSVVEGQRDAPAVGKAPRDSERRRDGR